MIRALSLLVAVVALALPARAFAAKAELQLDTTEVREGQTVTLTLVVADATVRGVPRFTAPDGLDVSYQGQSQQRVIINFNSSLTTHYRYALGALRQGTYAIGPVTVQTDQGAIEAPAVRLDVTARPPGGDDGLVAEIDTREAWVGQVLVYHLRFRTEKALVQGRWTPPDPGGLTAEPSVEPLSTEYELLEGGERVSVQELHYPLRATAAGRHTIPGAVLQAQFAVPKERRRRPGHLDSIFRDLPGFSDVRSEVFSAPPTEVEVRPLPDAGRPPGFGGLVGRFTVTATASSAEVDVGDTVTVEVVVEGDGPLAGVGLPPLTADGFRVYDDQPAVESRLTDGRYRARAVFRRAIVPQRPGELTVPPIELSWFDPVEGRYVVESTEPLVLQVGGQAGNAAVASFAEARTRGVDALGEDILPVRTDTRVSAPLPAALAWVLVLPGAALLGAQAIGAMRARRVPKAAVYTFADLPSDPEGRLAGLERIFRERAARRLGVSVDGLHRDEVARLGPDAEALYRELEALRYGGARGELPEARVRAFVEGG